MVWSHCAERRRADFPKMDMLFGRGYLRLRISAGMWGPDIGGRLRRGPAQGKTPRPVVGPRDLHLPGIISDVDKRRMSGDVGRGCARFDSPQRVHQHLPQKHVATTSDKDRRRDDATVAAVLIQSSKQRNTVFGELHISAALVPPQPAQRNGALDTGAELFA